MKKHYSSLSAFIFSSVLLINNTSSAQYAWKQMADFGGTTRQGCFAFAIGNYGYIGSGYNGSNYSDFWQYNPSTNSWTQESDLPLPVRAASGFVVNGKGYVTNGIGNSSFISNLWEYDPTLNTWTSKANFPGLPRYGCTFFSIGTKGYCGMGNGGTANGPYYTDFYEYDPATDSWTQVANFPGTARYGSYGIALTALGYTGFGTNLPMGLVFNDWWVYDPVGNSWSAKTSFPATARSYPMGFTINAKIYVGTGTDVNGASLSDFYEYNPTTDTWAQKQDYGGGKRWTVVGFSIGNIGYFGTGVQNGYSIYYKDFWEYAPSDIPVASFQSNDSSICANSCINFIDQSVYATSWQWSFPGATPSSSTDQNPQNICYLTIGNYNVSLIASNNTGSDTLNLVNYITVKPIPPTPTIKQVGTTLFCSTDTSYTSYQWYDSSAVVTGATDTFLVATHSGNYNVKVSNIEGCSVAVGINYITGLTQPEPALSFIIFPNPVHDVLNIHLTKNISRAEIKIEDVLGRNLFQANLNSSENFNQSIDFSKFSKGVYFITISSVESSITRKIVKE